jgi:hypothetical protein
MGSPASPRKRIRHAALLLLAGSAFVGCSTPKNLPSAPTPSAAQRPEFLKPSLLYLQSSPHSRLYVEVDAVEGCEPTETALVQLQAFLTKHCQKPDGVEIMVSDIIPRKTARQTSLQTLARRYVNGPPASNEAPPAFMYVLYYPGWPGVTPPYAQPYPYPSIYFNRRFSFGFALNEILLHEASHLLGLVHRTERAANGHCRNSGCQMNNHWGYLRQFRWLPGRKQSPLCADCVGELAQITKQPPLSNWRHVGPVLVRSEANYDVLALPERILLTTGGTTEADCQQFTANVRAEKTTSSDGWFRVNCRVEDKSFDNPSRVAELMSAFGADSLPPVRKIGPKMLLRQALDHYETSRQYSNAIVVLNQAIQLDPQDAWFYTVLARIKATSPDASVRNSQDAMRAATKACDLTKWREWPAIDALAAASAEAGDFQRAIGLQQQALRTGKPDAASQTAMRARLSLYEQSRPFRE